MQTLRVCKERHGWAVRLDPGMCTPFWSEARAICEAERLCQSLRVHGVEVEVVIEAEPAMVGPGATRDRDREGHTAWR
jgi:hypothetical protein